MIKTKTADLTGPALDWAVAKCEGYKKRGALRIVGGKPVVPCLDGGGQGYTPSTSWALGGPILKRLMLDGMLLEAVDHEYRESMPAFKATLTRWRTLSRADTPLEAAMRCYVASNLGSEVDVPEALL